MNTLEDRKILITAGPTWVPIDSVRVITNIFKGTLGLIIAEEAVKRGAKVTLLLGPASPSVPSKTCMFKVVRFKFFDDLYKLMKQEISSHEYDAVVHSAAVADYMPIECYDGKIKSGKTDLVIKLKPTTKIVDQVKKWDSEVFLVKFKVESNVDKKELVRRAYESMLASNADLIVANDLKDIDEKRHKALIIDLNRSVVSSGTKEEIAKNLLDIIARS
jgi:phosphopantothenoylcysteine synthetase/decarboxylase